MSHRIPFALAGLALAAAASAGDSATWQHEKTAQVVVLDHSAQAGGPDKAHVVVTSRSVDGAAPGLQVKMLGEEGAVPHVIDVGELQDGETREFTTPDGKEIVVTRSGAGLTLNVDGKEIEMPSIMNFSVVAGDAPGFVTAHAFATGASATATTGEDVVVLAPHHAVALPLGGQFEHLETLKGLDPEVREKVLAALKEMFSTPGAMGFAFETKVPEPGEPGAAGLPRKHVMVRRVVVDDDADGSGSEGGSRAE